MESQAKKKNAKLEKLSVFAKQNKNSLIRYGLLIAVLLVFSVSTNGRIFSRFSVSSIISQLTPLMIMCVGLMFVFAHGNIDIAEGAVLAVCALTSIQIVNALGGSAGGVLLAKLMNKLSGGKINPLIGSAGVSAVPMAARVSQKEGQKANPANFLLMHAMGPNVAGVIGSAIAAGVLLSMFG